MLKKLQSKENRPPLTVFGPGFFVEDFTYKERTDETVLDENNGRFCITPQYPNGVMHILQLLVILVLNKGGQFNSYKLPVFPYLLGDNYYSTPNEFNFSIFQSR